METFYDRVDKIRAKKPLALPAAAREPIRELLLSKGVSRWARHMDELAQKVVEIQLSTYNEHVSEAATRSSKSDSLFDSAALKIAESIGDDLEEDVKFVLAIPQAVTRRAIWRWEKLPYALFCMLSNVLSGSEPDKKRLKTDVAEDPVVQPDEWILSNEKWLRDNIDADWTSGMVQFSTHANIVFPGSVLSSTSRTLTRTPLPGYTFLDKKRAETIEIQPSVNQFSTVFSKLTDGLLEGLNWDNVFVAGGIILGSLLCVDTPNAANKPEDFVNSDIDIYIHGLPPSKANKKIKHIFRVFEANLPPDAPIPMVVRNSKTITFISEYPWKRIQIVLKLVKSPKEVLLNFDLDICAMGWNGKELWMLPRAARALETGYNVFTMSLIEGHYLGERRASQEQRVFKYADRGYGIRILNSYIESLKEHDPVLDLEASGAAAREWTDMIIRKYIDHNHQNVLSYIGIYNGAPRAEGPGPVFSHALLETRSQKTDEPLRRDCLTGFTLLMRHVKLWEMGVEGTARINDEYWSSTTYDESAAVLSYDDSPQYKWDALFYQNHFASDIDGVNSREADVLKENWDWVEEEELESPVETPKRITYADSASLVLDAENDLVIPVWVPSRFAKYANDLIDQALREADILIEGRSPTLVAGKPESADGEGGGRDELRPYFWKIDTIIMWQQLDRRIDEIYEILWSFHRGAAKIGLQSSNEQARAVACEIARRAIRKTVGDEYASFAIWAGRQPEKPKNRYFYLEQGFWWLDDPEDEEE